MPQIITITLGSTEIDLVRYDDETIEISLTGVAELVDVIDGNINRVFISRKPALVPFKKAQSRTLRIGRFRCGKS